MKDNKKIEAAKKVIELMQTYINGEDIEKLIDGKYVTVTESTGIESICIYNISRYRIKPKYKPCFNKNEFINLLLEDVENMAIMQKATGKLYYIHSITDINVHLSNKYDNFTAVNYNKLFEDYEFYNRVNTIIGVENK